MKGELVMATTVTDHNSTRRVRAAAVLTRFGSRATKRAVAAGKFVTVKPAKSLVRNIKEPYSTLKLTIGTLAVLVIMVIGWYIAFLTAVAIASSTGNWILAFLGAWAVAAVYCAAVQYPASMLLGEYATNAGIYKGTTPRAKKVKVVDHPADRQTVSSRRTTRTHGFAPA